MDPFTARLFVEQVLQMGSPVMAAQYVQANAQRLDDTFFQVLVTMVQQERANAQVNPGVFMPGMPGEIADRFLQDASAGSQRLQALQMLLAFAMQLRQGAAFHPAPSRPQAQQPEPLRVTCPRCRQTQPIVCPGFGRHFPMASALPGANGPQCAACGAVFSYVTCTCGQTVPLGPQPAVAGSARREGEPRKGEKGLPIEELERMLQTLSETGRLTPDMAGRLRAAANDPGKLDAMLGKLKELGAEDVGSGPPLQIEDHYQERPGKFQLQWPLDTLLPLPLPFDRLDRKTQFYVLFQEWSRREMEGMMALNGGNLEEAERTFKECLERARQIEVRELMARSYEGLMRLAQKRGDRASEKQWSQEAMGARRD
ncbi:MAG: hypothetical protein HY681_14805 [Chloroflexi bacterium]|nr:hypothetical protein [Chloroflexota bacterium]